METRVIALKDSARAGGQLTKRTVFSSIFIILTTCIGAGTLSLLAQGGLLFSSVVLPY